MYIIAGFSLKNDLGFKIVAITEDDVKKIAYLARLTIAPEDIANYTTDMGNILQLAERMQQVDTSNIEPMAHPLDVSQRLRADEVTETDQRELLQANAPKIQDGYFIVPQVIE